MRSSAAAAWGSYTGEQNLAAVENDEEPVVEQNVNDVPAATVAFTAVATVVAAAVAAAAAVEVAETP